MSFFFNDKNNNTFEEIKNTNDHGYEFWYARDLQRALNYTQWRNFKNVIDKAVVACKASEANSSDHFANVSKTIDMPKGATKKINDIMLSRYACYLIMMNGDSSKKVIAHGQTYFAVQTRKQEVAEKFNELGEDKKRLAIRNELKDHNVKLADAAHDAGVEQGKDYAIFQNKGYQGLYGGLGAKEIHTKKGLKKSHKILDYMDSTELAANLFRATQTEEKLRRENIKGKDQANNTHYEVGAKVRQTIKELGGTMPEDLPAPEKSVNKIEKEQQKLIDNKGE